MVERAAFEMRCPLAGTGGSNPSLSAKFKIVQTKPEPLSPTKTKGFAEFRIYDLVVPDFFCRLIQISIADRSARRIATHSVVFLWTAS